MVKTRPIYTYWKHKLNYKRRHSKRKYKEHTRWFLNDSDIEDYNNSHNELNQQDGEEKQDDDVKEEDENNNEINNDEDSDSSLSDNENFIESNNMLDDYVMYTGINES